MVMWTCIIRLWFRIPCRSPFQQRQLSTMAALGKHKVHTTEHLTRLRALMKKDDVNVQAYVVPSADQRTFYTPQSLRVSVC